MTAIEFAMKHEQPCATFSRAGNYKPEEALQRFVEEYGIKVLNVAGSRESQEPGTYRWVYDVIEDAFFWSQRHPRWLGEGRERGDANGFRELWGEARELIPHAPEP